ncbi:MAG: AMP-binding protein [Pseudomonadota bacterium]
METLATLIPAIDGLAARADRPALVAMTPAGARTVGAGELHGQVMRLAAGLAARAGRGETVAIFAGDSPAWIAAALAAIRAGCAVLPLDVQASDENLAHMLADSGARLVFTTADRLERLAGANLPVVLLDAPADDARGLDALLAATGAAPPALPEPRPQDPAALFYTSGTTGLPKGVPLTHANLAFQLNAMAATGLLKADDRVALPLPLHHVYPFVMGVLLPVAMGLPLIIPQALTGPQVVRSLKEGGASVMIGVPRLYAAMFAAIEARVAARGPLAAKLFARLLAFSVWARCRLGLHLGRRLFGHLHEQLAPRLRLLACGGAAIDPELAWRLEGLGWRLAIGYGLTETAPLLTMNLPPSPRLDAVGPPVPGVEVRIDAAPGQVGEVQARGPNVFAGYRNLPDKTRDAFSADGWFRTGDLGRMEDGWLVLTGRAKELIVTAGGENVQPEEVERAFAAHPYIQEFALLEDHGRLLGLVLPEPGAIRRAGLDDVEAAVRQAVAEVNPRLPSYQRVTDHAVTRDPLPRTRLGKLRRHELLRCYTEAKAGRAETAAPLDPSRWAEPDRLLLEDPALARVWQALTRRYPDRHLAPDTGLRLDLGVDSLGWLDLAVEVQALTGAELSEEAIARIETVRDLLRAVQAAPALKTGTGAADHGRAWQRPADVLPARELARLRPHGGLLRTAHRLLAAANRLVMRRAFRLRVEGLEHLPAGQFVLAPNHTSFLDPFAVAACLPAATHLRTAWGGFTGIAFGNPVTRFFSRIGRVLPVDPVRGAASALALAAAALDQGDPLVWFPEGRRSADGHLQALRPGLGLLMARSPLPVVPVHIAGAFAAMPLGKRWPRRSPIRVCFGPPLDTRAIVAEAGEAAPARITEALAARLAAMQGSPTLP